MSDPIIEFCPSIPMQGNGEDQKAVVFEHTTHFAEGPSVILGVFNDIERTYQIEFTIAEWHRADFSWHGDSASGVQSLDRLCADVDEIGAGNRQPGTKARSDLKSRRC